MAVHDHDFDAGNPLGARNTRRAMWLTAAMMLAEIAGGWWYNSMALLADGWHMGSHALALGLSAFAYAFARRHRGDARYSFGTWKVEILGGYTSAIALFGVAALMAVQSLQRLLAPSPIDYRQAMVLAALGLAVNLVCAWWLRDGHHHDHGQGHGHHHHDHDHPDHDHDRHDHHDHLDHHDRRDHGDHGDHGSHVRHVDLNLRSAYLHVVADAATSVLAIIALLGGLLRGWAWLDPVMGLVGSVLVALWARGLVRETAQVLLDMEPPAAMPSRIRDALARSGLALEVIDLHAWRVGRGRYACVLALATPDPAMTAARVRDALAGLPELAHLTIELSIEA
jgi:cation diffusion facilitator family transporter